MIIDCTTKNQVYDSTSPQGEWYAHRWGKRNYPEVELTSAELQSLYCATTEPMLLKCTYGDPADWTDINSFLRSKSKYDVIVDTYGMFKGSTLRILKRQERLVNIEIDGWTNTMGQVFLGQDYETVKDTIIQLQECCVVYYHLYHHNIEDAKEFCKFAESYNITIQVKPGRVTNDFYHSVIDQDANWLYDVFPVEFEELQEHEKLITVNEHQSTFYPFPEPDPIKSQYRKSLAAYNTLRTFMQDPDGTSILDNPLVTPVFPHKGLKVKFLKEALGDDNRYVAPTGHILPSIQLGSSFMYMLCTDWKFKKSDVLNVEMDQYRLKLLHYAQELSQLDLEKINIRSVH